MKLHSLFSHVLPALCFLIGLSIGITACVYVKSFSSNSYTAVLYTSLTQSTTALVPPPNPSPAPPQTPDVSRFPFDAWHNMNDDELLLKVKTVEKTKRYQNKRVPRIAFMFLTKGPLPLRPLWELFFKGHEGLYSIYVHPHPSFNHSMPQRSVFHGRRIPSKPVKWGRATMIDAERRLLANALLDYPNERFILLSESCIPLYNFTAIYNYLINTNQTFIGSFDDPRKFGRGRYNLNMFPIINISDWRKGSQWFEVNRKLAIEIVSDTKYYPIFKRFCRPPCYMDEHYIPTLTNILRSNANSNRSITWVDWSKGGSHPGKFNKNAISVQFLNRIRSNRKCIYNGDVSSICFLFARKFLPDSLQPLLQIVPSLY